MRREADKIVLESRREVDILQDVLEIYIATSKSVGEEEHRAVAGEAAALLDAMYREW